MTKNKEKLERMLRFERDEGNLKRCFDLWVLNFGIKNSCGITPGWFSLANSMFYVIDEFYEKQKNLEVENAKTNL